MAKKKRSLTPEKAAEMLRDGTAHGRPLTAKQTRMLYAIRSGEPQKARKKRKK
jgi:hypothetical protein